MLAKIQSRKIENIFTVNEYESVDDGGYNTADYVVLALKLMHFIVSNRPVFHEVS